MYSEYGATPQSSDNFYEHGPLKPRRVSGGPCIAAHAFFQPSLIFASVSALHAFLIQWVPTVVVAILDVVIIALAVTQVSLAWRRRAERDHWLRFIVMNSVLAFVLGVAAGVHNHRIYGEPYHLLEDLNMYMSVDPSTARGQSLMDGGRFVFTAGSHLDLSKSMEFKSKDLYCVAPVVSADSNASVANYDLWAVGKGCCSEGEFHCGEYRNQRAIGGLRKVENGDGEREYYRLAVQKAEAAYHITAAHPIFLTLVENPIEYVAGLEGNASGEYLVLFFAWLLWQAFATACAALVIAKL